MNFFRQLKLFLMEVLLCFVTIVVTLLLIIPAVVYCVVLAIFSTVDYFCKKISKSESVLADSKSYYKDPAYYNAFEEDEEDDFSLYDEENYDY